MKGNRSPQDVDMYAGQQLRARRKELSLSQKNVAERVKVTFQQIQKYEKGLNRIGVSRLHQFCKILGVKPSFFFQDFQFKSRDYKRHSVKDRRDNFDYGAADIASMIDRLDPDQREVVITLIRLLNKQSNEL